MPRRWPCVIFGVVFESVQSCSSAFTNASFDVTPCELLECCTQARPPAQPAGDEIEGPVSNVRVGGRDGGICDRPGKDVGRFPYFRRL
jgi:hypothetical protein